MASSNEWKVSQQRLRLPRFSLNEGFAEDGAELFAFPLYFKSERDALAFVASKPDCEWLIQGPNGERLDAREIYRRLSV